MGYDIPQRYRLTIRNRAENIIHHLPGVKSVAKDKKSPNQCFSLFISDNMIADIVNYTNEKIRLQSSNDPQKSETTLVEMKALFGLLFLSGLARSGRQNTIDLHRWYRNVFRDTVCRNRFVFLLQNLRFDSTATRSERIKIDRLAAIRSIFEHIVKNCQDVYIPYENLTLDEELVAFRGRCGFRQYIPSKPAKYGIKIYALVDNRPIIP